MKAIITVVGKDKVGIIAAVCSYLADSGINILDISQTIIKGYFNMVMIVDMDTTDKAIELVSDELKELGEKIGVMITIQHEGIFSSMHRI